MEKCMKQKLLLLLSCLALAGTVAQAAPLGMAFTYQGRLDQNSQPVTGIYQMTFWLYAASSGGSPIASNTVLTVPVNNGLFTTNVDFGTNRFTGDERWLAITVATNGSSVFTLLQPRTRVAPTPNAIYASMAGTVADGAIQVNQLGTLGSVPSAGQFLSYNGSSLLWQTPPTSLWQSSGNNAYYDAGNVGIGTATPSHKLDVNGAGYFRGDLLIGAAETEAGLGTFLIYGWAPLGQQPLARFVVRQNGNVGVGTGNPQAALDVRGYWDVGIPALQLGGEKPTIRFAADPVSGNQEWLLHLGSDGPGNLQFFRKTGSIYDSVLALGANGNVGIGTTTPTALLHVNSSATGSSVLGALLEPNLANGGFNQIYLGRTPTGNGCSTFTYTYDAATPANSFLSLGLYNSSFTFNVRGDGNVGIGTTVPQAKLDVRGTTRTCVLEITGGCDLAEPFPMKEEEIEKGSVVIIDEEHPGRLKLSTRAYDTQVAGIVSGANGINPGIALKQEGALDQGRNVALSGRVYVKADASLGAIKPGDLLTTSDTPGHAMKVSHHTKSQGAILGKAMSALKEGTGLVLVLVTLQ